MDPLVLSGDNVVCAGETIQCSVSGGTSPYSWTSSDETIATVDSSGLVTTLTTGEVMITVSDYYECDDSLTLSILLPDIDVDADYDDDRDADDEALEDNPGGLVAETRDSDNPSRTAVVLRDPGVSGWTGNFRITSGSSNVKLYTSLIGDSYLSFDDWMPVSLLPMTLWAQSDEPSATMRDMELTMELDDPSGCEDTIHLSSMRVDFTNSTSMKYGFDGVSTELHVYKSVMNGDSDVLDATILPEDGVAQVYFESDELGSVQISPSQAVSTPQEITVTGLTADDDSIGATAYLGAPEYLQAASMSVYSFEELTKRVAIYYVTEATSGIAPSNTVTDAQIQTYLNESVYNQAVCTFDVVSQGSVSVAYDANSDGTLNADTNEYDLITTAYPLPANFNYVIYVLKDVQHDLAAGFSPHGTNMIHSFVGDSTGIQEYQLKTIAHELGHTFGGLAHPSPTRAGLMGSWDSGEISGEFLYYDEWETIHEKN